jgi:periplasmic protein TonB
VKTKTKFNIFIFVFFSTVFASQLRSQKLSIERPAIDSKLNQIASFQGLGKYIGEHLKYPELAKENGMEGIVEAEVVINSMGAISAVKIIQGLNFGCDEAVLKVLSNMPAWNPSLKNGMPIAQKLTVTIKFSLW